MYRNSLLHLLDHRYLSLLQDRNVNHLLEVLNLRHWHCLHHFLHHGNLASSHDRNIHHLVNILHLRNLHSFLHSLRHRNLHLLRGELWNDPGHCHYLLDNLWHVPDHFLHYALFSSNCLLNDLWPLNLNGLDRILDHCIHNRLHDRRNLGDLLLNNDLGHLDVPFYVDWLWNGDDLLDVSLCKFLLVGDHWHLHNILNQLRNRHRHLHNLLNLSPRELLLIDYLRHLDYFFQWL
mmetsp:Transcript_35638/g.83366  ORF Transcript_35638/g.83366 Transcript_35638/m.83366 type:complete len:234 (+) Transcript_35638:1277-1978(+)